MNRLVLGLRGMSILSTTVFGIGGLAPAREPVRILRNNQKRCASLLSSRRPKRKYKFGETRPAIYYNFDCLVELSDGSTYVRQSQYPRVEWRYLRDQRVHPLWNPQVEGLKTVQSETGGKISKFNKKYNFVGEEASESNDTPSADVDDISMDDMMSIMEDSDYKPNTRAKILTKKNRRY
ncbi:hypothetical protein V1511DRAFT_250766 [Dipodascopsis uninucleata]